MEKILSYIKNRFHVSHDAEWTMEANPNSLSNAHLSVAGRIGVTRLSLGVQSFSDEVLRFLGRPHSAKDALGAFRMARDAGFDNIGLDLIYGIPGQSDQQWHETLEQSIKLGPEHLSVYSLSLDEGSRFASCSTEGLLHLPEDVFVNGQYEHALRELKKAGYEQYEISNFSLPGRECRHNLNYWHRGEYLGLGPGAWSFRGGRRYSSIADVRQYCLRLEKGETILDQQETVTEAQAADEMVMLGFRTTDGLDLLAYQERFGAEAAARLEGKAGSFKGAGLVEIGKGSIRLTEKGFLLANEVLAGILT